MLGKSPFTNPTSLESFPLIEPDSYCRVLKVDASPVFLNFSNFVQNHFGNSIVQRLFFILKYFPIPRCCHALFCSFSNIQTDTFVEILSTLQCQKYPQGMRLGLEYHFFPNWRQQNPFCFTRNILKNRN